MLLSGRLRPALLDLFFVDLPASSFRAAFFLEDFPVGPGDGVAAEILAAGATILVVCDAGWLVAALASAAALRVVTIVAEAEISVAKGQRRSYCTFDLHLDG